MSKPFTEVPLPKEKPLCIDFATAIAAGLRPRCLLKLASARHPATHHAAPSAASPGKTGTVGASRSTFRAGCCRPLGFPKLELLRSALVVVLDGWLGVVRRLLREEFRAEEPWVDDGGSDPEWRDLGVQRLHPALQAELRRGVGANELEAGGEAR